MKRIKCSKCGKIIGLTDIVYKIEAYCNKCAKENISLLKTPHTPSR